MSGGPITEERLIGREEPLARIRASLDLARSGERSMILLAGEAGIGKTSLIRTATKDAPLLGWGTGVDEAGAPGYWPWSVALGQIAEQIGASLDGALTEELGPLLDRKQAGGPATSQDQLVLREGVRRWLDAASKSGLVIVVLDDLQWADESSVSLLSSIARSPGPAKICLIASYRQDELQMGVRERLAELAGIATHIELEGLAREEVARFVVSVISNPSETLVDDLYRRAGGHPVFTRELALLSGSNDPSRLPIAVRDAISRRVRLLPEATKRVLEPVSLSATSIHRSVIVDVLDLPLADVESALQPAQEARLITATAAGSLSFAHDLYREAVAASISPEVRVAHHLALGVTLERRSELGDEVKAAELARHFCEAIPLGAAERARLWAISAARADQRTMAFLEAAAHLKRWRAGIADAGVPVDDLALIDALVVEADALSQAGTSIEARGILRLARDIAVRAGAVEDLARIALAVTRLGATFATRRDDVIAELEAAITAVRGTNIALEAQVTAALARELQHSVASDRPRAEPLSARALELGHEAGDTETLIACLLARHDLLWTPGRAEERVEVAHAIVGAAEGAGDVERHAEGLLLLANALLECGSGAALQALETSVASFEELRRPRHRYVALSRRAALALIRGDLDGAEELIEGAAELGDHILEPDSQNVRMSQRLELIRTLNDPDVLARFASEAVEHWRGAPIHANVVAAGFLTRAGDLDGAKRHVTTVLDLGTWSAERSYLWSVFMRELAVAAVGLEDQDLCQQLLDEVLPVKDTCGVNGACVAFAGAHAHTAALLSMAIGLPSDDLLRAAAEMYHRLGAPLWAAEVESVHGAPEIGDRTLLRRSRSWDISFDGERVSVPHSKGLADIALLLSRPGRDVHVLDLYGSKDVSGSSGDLVDGDALRSYRDRLADLGKELAEADEFNDLERGARLRTERDALLAELRSVAGLQGRSRTFSNHPTERARKAVSARIRDLISRIAADAPRFSAHLDRNITTGVLCRYLDETGPRWVITDTKPEPSG